MSLSFAWCAGMLLGFALSFVVLINYRNSRLVAEYEHKIQHLLLAQQAQTEQVVKKSLLTSRATIKGKVAEQFAPLMPEFDYLPSDAKFIGDPVDYIIFDGYTQWREGNQPASSIQVVLMDIKSGNARLSKGQRAIQEAIYHGRIRFETLHINPPADEEMPIHPASPPAATPASTNSEQAHSLIDKTMLKN